VSQGFSIRISDAVTADDRRELEDRLNAFNVESTGFRDARDLSCLLRDAEGTLVAGIDGFSWGGYAYVEVLWVSEPLRGEGIGRRLLEAAEAEARKRGCTSIVLASHEFQAPGFYTKLGYHTVGTTEDTPIGYREFHFQKRLAATGELQRVARVVASIRDARPDEALALEALQRRSSEVWEEYRAQLAANPDAIEPPHRAIADGRVRIAVDALGRRLGFSVVLPVRGGRCELDDLFVEPDSMGLGIGRLLVDDVVTRAAAAGASHLDVIANPNALGFYERLGFGITGQASTRFGDAPRMSRVLSPKAVSRGAPRAPRAPSCERDGAGPADCPR
jgi:ribosomal protein S18 acetylase RimI-like enzyme